MENLLDNLKTLLKKDERLVSEGELLKNKIIELALKLDKDLLKLLLSNKKMKEVFFVDVDGALVFDKDKFLRFVSNKQFLPDSYTSFKNKIGLTVEDEFISEKKEVVLSWPYKDCVLEGEMTKEDQKRDEIFWNEILAPDEISRLLDPKVFTNAKRIDKNGESPLLSLRGGDSRRSNPVFRTDEKGDIKDNLIIKGNNLLALHSLKKRFAGKIKLIYIDPPYNTGNDEFKYNDAFNHSSWLTFIKNRLEVAKQLLNDQSVIFIQCDDNEQAYLKVLCDDIFDRDRFVGMLVWQRAKGGGQAKEIVRGHDYILVYRNFDEVLTLKRQKSIQKPIIEINGRKYIKNDDFLRKVFGKYSENKTKEFDRRCFYEEIEKYKGKEKKKEVDKKIKAGEYILEKHPSGKHIVCRLEPLEMAYSTFYSIIKNIDDTDSPVIEGFLSEKGKYDLGKLRIKGFEYPKPVGLIKVLIKSVMMFEKEGMILDFFAGSGTTAQAVLELNKEDGGNRQFILCEQLDYVDTITIPRVKKVVKKLGGGDFVYFELMKWNENFVEKIKKAKTREELKNLWETMKEKAFLSYKVDVKTIDEHAKDFADLSIGDQKRFLLECLDKNHLYVNYSEIDDEEYGVSEEDKKLNKEFYS
jgi:adenine-specific DNA-methyltransferase